MKKSDAVFSNWRFTSVFKNPNPKGAKAVIREFADSTLDKVWGLKPVYVPGVVIRRKAVVAYA